MTISVSRPAQMAFKPLALALAAAALPSFASAQTSPDQPLTSLLVTASRRPQAVADVLSDNSVISAQEIAQSGQHTLVDLLQQKRGIEISRNGGPASSSSVFIRGASNAQSIVLVDGVRIESATIGGATWETIPLSQIDHVEIVYGPLSSLYGSGAMGGVIQIFTKKGEGAVAPSVAVGVGAYRTRNVEAGVSGAAAEGVKLHYAIRAAHEEADGFSATKPDAGPYTYNADKDGYKKDSAGGQFSLELAKGHELGVSFLQSRLGVQFDAGPGYDDRSVEKLENYALYSKNRVLAAWSSTLQWAQSADKNYSDASYGKSQFDTRQTDLSWQNDIALGTDVVQFVLERREEKVASSTSELNGKRSTNSEAVAYQLKRGAHLASASLRNDQSGQFGSHATGGLAYGYRITQALRANASVGTSFRAPTFNELYYPGYGIASNAPERGKNAEAGLYFEDGATQLSAVYYRNRITDLLVYAATCPIEAATHPYGCAYNLDHALLAGLTLGGSAKLGRFTVRGSLDVQDARDETTDKAIPRRARQHASLGLEYGAGTLRAGAEAVLSGKRFDDIANNDRLGGYGVLNLYANYEVAPGWSLFARWNNALNKDYELAKSYATAGSNLFVGVRYGLK